MGLAGKDLDGKDYQTAESTQRSANASVQIHVLFGKTEPALLYHHNATAAA